MDVEIRLMADQVEKVARYYADKVQEPRADGKLARRIEAMAMQAMAAQIEMQKLVLLAEILEKMPDKPYVKAYPNGH